MGLFVVYEFLKQCDRQTLTHTAIRMHTNRHACASIEMLQDSSFILLGLEANEGADNLLKVSMS